MHPKKSPSQRILRAAAAVTCLLLFAYSGCMHEPPDELTKGVISGERPVAMEGNQPFFGGKVLVKVTIGRGIGRGLKRGGADRDRTYSAYRDSDTKQLVGSPLPPVTLHLVLTNPGAESVTVKLLDFESDMGNFALEPDTLTIAAGQSAQPTSMVSQLGVSADEMPFTVGLKLGTAKEIKTFPVRVIPQDLAAPSQK